jgi:hypothetical protein
MITSPRGDNAKGHSMYDEIEDEYNGASWEYDDLDNWGQQESWEDSHDSYE